MCCTIYCSEKPGEIEDVPITFSFAKWSSSLASCAFSSISIFCLASCATRNDEIRTALAQLLVRVVGLYVVPFFQTASCTALANDYRTSTCAKPYPHYCDGNSDTEECRSLVCPATAFTPQSPRKRSYAFLFPSSTSLRSSQCHSTSGPSIPRELANYTQSRSIK